MTHATEYPVWHHVPPQAKQSSERWPLLLFLHGAGERGTDFHGVTRHGPPKIASQQADFPFVVVAPQCPPDQRWQVHLLLPVLDAAMQRFPVDPARVYLTGISMGGAGAWQLAAAAPNRFAALVPICGYGDPAKVGALRRIPTRVFHGARDKVVLPERSVTMVRALEDAGGNVTLTVYPEAGHEDAWKQAYGDPQLFEWLLQQRISGP
jgi:predicted peptidase